MADFVNGLLAKLDKKTNLAREEALRKQRAAEDAARRQKEEKEQEEKRRIQKEVDSMIERNATIPRLERKRRAKVGRERNRTAGVSAPRTSTLQKKREIEDDIEEERKLLAQRRRRQRGKPTNPLPGMEFVFRKKKDSKSSKSVFDDDKSKEEKERLKDKLVKKLEEEDKRKRKGIINRRKQRELRVDGTADSYVAVDVPVRRQDSLDKLNVKTRPISSKHTKLSPEELAAIRGTSVYEKDGSNSYTDPRRTNDKRKALLASIKRMQTDGASSTKRTDQASRSSYDRDHSTKRKNTLKRDRLDDYSESEANSFIDDRPEKRRRMSKTERPSNEGPRKKSRSSYDDEFSDEKSDDEYYRKRRSEKRSEKRSSSRSNRYNERGYNSDEWSDDDGGSDGGGNGFYDLEELDQEEQISAKYAAIEDKMERKKEMARRKEKEKRKEEFEKSKY